MNRMAMPGAVVGNEFVIPQPRSKTVKVEASIPALTMSPQEVLPAESLGNVNDVSVTLPVAEAASNTGEAELDQQPLNHNEPHHGSPHDTTPLKSHRSASSPFQSFIDFLHRHTFIVIALSLLIIGAAVIKLGANYWTAKNISLSDNTAKISTSRKPIAGFNLTIPAADFQSKLKNITSQPVSLTVGSYSEQLNSDFVKSWLQITANKDKSEYYIHLNEAAMSGSLLKEANEYARTPVNQVTVKEDGASRVVVAGQNGRALSDPNGLKTQTKLAAKNVLAGKGLQFNTPMKTTPFQALTPANFDKLIVSDVTKKKMWAFQGGKEVNSWLVSAGKPSTPTPLGQFKIYAKFTVQDMRGSNADGSTYFQPHVRWVNYFYQGSAIHGVYWHPLSWFGAINSSHGCIGVPDDQAKWIFDWAPIGTPVIVHA